MLQNMSLGKQSQQESSTLDTDVSLPVVRLLTEPLPGAEAVAELFAKQSNSETI